MKIFDKNQRLPVQWPKYLRISENKVSLVEFLFTHLSDLTNAKPANICVYLAHGNSCHLLQFKEPFEVRVVDELECDHEEADTRLLLHALYASRDNHNVIVQSPDTDVAMIALLYP